MTLIRSEQVLNELPLRLRQAHLRQGQAPIHSGRVELPPVFAAPMGHANHQSSGTAVDTPTPPFVVLETQEASTDLAMEEQMRQVQANAEMRVLELVQQHQQQVEALQAQLAQAREDERAVGYQEGFEAGQSTARDEVSAHEDRVERVLVNIEHAFTEGITGVEDAAVEIAFEAVMKILGGALVDREGVIAVVREIIRHAKDREHVVLRVSHDDFGLLHAHRSEFTSGGDESRLEIVADDRVALGGCLLEASGGSLDGRLEVQLQQFRDALLAVRARGAEGAP
jgi:flagellar assembly protein FliH